MLLLIKYIIIFGAILKYMHNLYTSNVIWTWWDGTCV